MTYTKKEPKYNFPATPLQLKTFMNVGIYKSIRRAIKRRRCTPSGIDIPDRPFNNRGNSSNREGVHSRAMNENKRSIYEELKRKTV